MHSLSGHQFVYITGSVSDFPLPEYILLLFGVTGRHKTTIDEITLQSCLSSKNDRNR